MEVIKKGITPKNWRYIGYCPHCESKLSVGYKDINMYPEPGFFRPKLRFDVRCCVCKNPIRLEASKVPVIIRQAIFYNMLFEERVTKFFF